MWRGICLLLLLIEAGAAVLADVPSKLFPSTVSVGSYLPPQDSSDNVGLASPDGIFNLRIQPWRSFPSYYCMAGVVSTKINPGSMLWGANNAQPLVVSATCRLYLSPEGDLILQYDGDKIAWQTHTAGMGVSNLTLENSGNLVLHTQQGIIVWQSFTQSPAFALTSGMHLTPNITIYSSAAIPDGVTSFNVPGSFAMQLHSHSDLVLFTNSNDSHSRFVYWSYSTSTRTGQVSYVALDDALTFYDSSSVALGSIASHFPDPPSNSSLRVALLDPPSANLLAFYRSNHTWVLFFNSSISVCENPKYCGSFGLCDVTTGACTCPSGFLQNSARDCQPADTDPSMALPSCSSSAAHDSKEAISYRFVHVNVSFPPQQLSAISSNSAENCGSLCVDSCTCRAALFDPGTRSCSLFSSLPTLPSRADSTQLMLLKMVARRQSRAKKHLAAVAGGISAAIVGIVLCCFVCAAAALRRTKRKREAGLRGERNEEGFLQALPRLPPRYTYKELEAATEGFSRKLGSGAFGAVYEGVLPSGVKIAVKKLEEGSGQSSAQFRAEVASIGSVSHVNLVTLRGFCHEGDGRLLVYEHMGNGSLDRWLFKGGDKLGWERRCKIAMDTAKGLAYLHHECGERIVHCDVKPENILLDEEFNAKVGDFGLAKLVGQGHHSFAMTSLKGTRGYVAPEWLHQATITAKSDVYSFGIVMLELISGRRCLDSDYGYLPSLAFRIVRASSSNVGHANQRQRMQFIERVPSSSTEDWSEEPMLQSLAARSQDEFMQSEESSFCQSGGDGVALSFGRPRRIGASKQPLPPDDTANPHGHSDMLAFLDPSLSAGSGGTSLPSNVERMMFIALWCVQQSPGARPSMAVVVQMMEGMVDIPPLPLQNPEWDTQGLSTSTSFSISHASTAFSHQISQPQSS